MTKKSELEIKQWLELFQEVSDFHWELNVLPIWEKYEKGEKPWQSVALFLSTYVFQTSGASPNYAPISADMIESYKKFDIEMSQNVELEKNIWSAIEKEMERHENLNSKKHSLWPNKQSLLRRMKENKMTNIVNSMRTYLQESRLKEAFDFLKSIRGVGPKVASFFLRDIKEYFSIKLPKDEFRNYLQPVDI